jgi:hypothetical protein
MADISKQDALEELRRRGVVTGGYTSVLEKPQEKPTMSEFKDMVESLFKGSAKGIINIVGGWGTLYDELSKSKDPSAFSSKGIVNTIARVGGPDLNKIEGWKGLYTLGEAGAPAALMSGLGGNLFKLSTPTRTAAAEFGAAGGLGLLGQSVAPESPAAQLTIQTLPYLVKGGVQGLKTRSAEKKIEEYRSLLPKQDQNIFDTFILKGQGSTDPQIANDILRLTQSTKFGELVAMLNSGASEKALSGMAPSASKLSNQQAAIAAAQAIQNKLEGLREHGAESLFEKAKKYGANTPLVDPTNTLNAIDGLIKRYSDMATPNAQKAVEVLQGIRDNLSPSVTTERFGPTSYTVREATPGYTTPSFPGGKRIVERQVTEYDSLGMPITKTIKEEVPFSAISGKQVAGTPEVRGVIPGGGGNTVNLGPRPLTIEKLQGFLSEFGRKSNQGDQLIKDLALSDEKIISSAIFGGLKDDLRASYNSATGADKAALGLLRQARDKVSTSVEKYQDAMAQGLPAWLKDKSLRDINFEELSAQYNKLTPDQRAYARTLIADTDAEALKALDKQVYDNFINQARTKNAVGQDIVDLGQLAQNWKNLSPVDKNNLVTSLGTNASEFEQRMKYADVFAKRARLSPEPQQAPLDTQTVREASAVAGAGGGYQVGKIAQLGLDIFNMVGKQGGLSEDQLAKLLLPKEGLDYLKNASMSPRGQKTLESLTALEQAPLPPFYQLGAQAGRAGARMGTADQPQVGMPMSEEQPQITPEQALEELKARGVL